MSDLRLLLSRLAAGLLVLSLAANTAWAQGGYVPAHLRGGQSYQPAMGEMHHHPVSGNVIEQTPMETAMPEMHGGHDVYGGSETGGPDYGCGGAGCESCGGGMGGDCGPCGGFFPWFKQSMQRMQFITGINAFSGPANRGETGSFGYQGGFNTGNSFLCGWQGLGWQVGGLTTLNNFNGASFTPEDRFQTFITAGMFRRVDWGLQGGLVYDYMHDEWNYSVDLAQLRGELSWVLPEGHDFGFAFTLGVSEHQGVTTIQRGPTPPVDVTEDWDVNNLNLFFYRHTFCGGSQARMFAGWSGLSDGVLGGDVMLPLNEQWMLRTGVTYVVPEQGPRDNGYEQESWNLGIQLVWTPCATNCGKDYYAPLFNVADNGMFFVDRR